jgi:hypothetical protein
VIQGNEVYVTGTTASNVVGGTEAVLIGLDATTGAINSTLFYGGALDVGANGIGVSGDDLYVAGYSSQTAGQSDAMLLTFSVATTPEPGPLALFMAVGVVGSVFCFRRVKRTVLVS